MNNLKGRTQGRFLPGYLTGALLVGAALVSFQGCVSHTKYSTLEDERDYCQKQLQQVTLEKTLLENKLKVGKTMVQESHQMYEDLVSHLEGEIAANQLMIEEMKSGVTLNLPEAVLFSSGAADLSGTGRHMLMKVAEKLENVPFQTLVGGFTDNVPIGGQLAERFPTNWELGAARAARVVRILEEGGVPGQRLRVVSFGQNEPMASNDTPEGRAQNRRIEIRLRPIVVEE